MKIEEKINSLSKKVEKLETENNKIVELISDLQERLKLVETKIG